MFLIEFRFLGSSLGYLGLLQLKLGLILAPAPTFCQFWLWLQLQPFANSGAGSGPTKKAIARSPATKPGYLRIYLGMSERKIYFVNVVAIGLSLYL